MRMWMVNPKFLCKNHLLGEHRELHTFIGTLKKGTSIEGYLRNKLLDPQRIYSRHSELVEEMKSRNYNHKSPLEIITVPNIIGEIDIKENVIELQRRCPECRKRIEAWRNKTNEFN